jgi:hypothetical protein
METVFLICAILGGTLVVCQVAAGLVGIGAEHDTDTGTDHDVNHESGEHGNWFLGMLSVRAVTSALLFFGLGGMTALYYGAEEPAAFGIAVGAGIVTLYAVAAMMRSLAQLKHDGTTRVERSVGRTGTVYLRVPAARGGSGKIHLMLQNRTVEYQAVTPGSELATGTPIRVVAVVNSDTVEVEAA